MYRAGIFTVVLMGAGGACDVEDGDSEPIEAVGPGNGSGTAYSGVFRLEREVTACEGRCGPLETDRGSVLLCEAGQRSTDDVFIEQDDGVFEAEVDDAVLGPWIGGIDEDGTFEVAAFLSLVDHEVDVTLQGHGEGRFFGPDRFEGSSRIEARGTYRGQAVRCISASVSVGERREDG